jgi:broad specificity phosphatase PhoE
MNHAIFVRHAESNFNLAGRISSSPGDHDCVLSSVGRLQAEALGRALSEVDIGLCMTSQLRRAQQTADIALDGRGIPRIETPDLNDVDAGEFDRGPAAAYLEWLEADGEWGFVPPCGGESLYQAARRYQTVFRWLLRCAEPSVLIITHALPVALATYGADPRNQPRRDLLLACFAQRPWRGLPQTVEHARPYGLKHEQLRTAVAFCDALLNGT